MENYLLIKKKKISKIAFFLFLGVFCSMIFIMLIWTSINCRDIYLVFFWVLKNWEPQEKVSHLACAICAVYAILKNMKKVCRICTIKPKIFQERKCFSFFKNCNLPLAYRWEVSKQFLMQKIRLKKSLKFTRFY